MDLRRTRRERTARDIQIAAVQLAVAHGVEAVTTDAIAHAAGVSPRTFFNYFPFKEAAILGPVLDYPEDAAAAFASGRFTLIRDLEDLIRAHLARLTGDRELIADMLRLSETDAKLQALRRSAFLGRRARLAELLSRRLPDTPPEVVHVLSHALIGAIGRAIEDWAIGREPDLISAACRNLSLIPAASALLES